MALASGLGSPAAFGQAWPTSDCSTLLQAGQPRPVWGSKEKPDQTTLLTLINYQLAISLCQQEEISKSLREQRTPAKEAGKPPLPKAASPASASAPTASSTDPLAEVLRDALSKQAQGLAEAARSIPPAGSSASSGGVTVTVKPPSTLELK